MKQTIVAAVANLFEHYDDTPELADFREEITMNLMDRVLDLQKKGISEQEALQKALDELGDVSEIADSIGKQKRKEAIANMVFHTPVDKKHAIAYTLTGVLFVIGLIVAIISGLRSGSVDTVITRLLPFAVISTCAFVFFGLTQETHTNYAMASRRSALYTAAAGLVALGVFLGGMILFRDMPFSDLSLSNFLEFKMQRIMDAPYPILGSVLLFIVPGIALLCFLVLTQKSRHKPWVIEQYQQSSKVYSEKFGLMSGSIWLFAIALFVLLGLWIGWHPAWVVFLFAIAGECLALFFFAKDPK